MVSNNITEDHSKCIANTTKAKTMMNREKICLKIPATVCVLTADTKKADDIDDCDVS